MMSRVLLKSSIALALDRASLTLTHFISSLPFCPGGKVGRSLAESLTISAKLREPSARNVTLGDPEAGRAARTQNFRPRSAPDRTHEDVTVQAGPPVHS